MNYVWKWFVYSKKKKKKTSFIHHQCKQLKFLMALGFGVVSDLLILLHYCDFWVPCYHTGLWVLSDITTFTVLFWSSLSFACSLYDCLDYLFVCLIMNVSYYPPVLVHAQSFSKSRKVDSVSVWIAALYLFEFSLFWSFESATTKVRLFLNILPPLSCIWGLICIIITKL